MAISTSDVVHLPPSAVDQWEGERACGKREEEVEREKCRDRRAWTKSAPEQMDQKAERLRQVKGRKQM